MRTKRVGIQNLRKLPSAPKKVAKVHPQRGIKVNYIYYWHDDFKNPDIAGTSVPVKYDPYNVYVVYARIKNCWVECRAKTSHPFESYFVDEVKRAIKARKPKPAWLKEFLLKEPLRESYEDLRSLPVQEGETN